MSGRGKDAPQPQAGGPRRASGLVRRAPDLGSVLDALDDAVILADEHASVLHLNARAEHISGWTRREATGCALRDVVQLVDARTRRPAVELLSLPADATQRRKRADLALVDREGGEHQVAATQAALAESDGKVTGLVLALHEGDGRARSLDLDRLVTLGTLALGAAHEMNDPLTSVMINVEHAARRLRALKAAKPAVVPSHETMEAVAQTLDQALEAAERLRVVVRDVAGFAGGDAQERGAIDPRDALEEALRLAKHQLRHRARVVRDLEDVPSVWASEARLVHALLAILANAADALPDGAADAHVVKVALRVDGSGHVAVEIADDGEGIAPEALPRVFEPFWSTRPGALGLGLTIARAAIDSLGGTIQIESERGRGTTARVLLPAGNLPSATLPAAKPRASRHPARARVLVVDDEPLVGQAIARVLSPDHDVVVAARAHEALARVLSGEPFDLILCDVMMPVMSGPDLYAELLRSAPHAVGAMVFMTGGASTAHARAFLQTIGNRVVEKPLDLAELRKLVEDALRRAR